MNTSRLFSLFFQGSLVKRISIGLLLGIVLALISPTLEPVLQINLAEKAGFLGKIFVRGLRAVAPILVFVSIGDFFGFINCGYRKFHISNQNCFGCR